MPLLFVFFPISCYCIFDDVLLPVCFRFVCFTFCRWAANEIDDNKRANKSMDHPLAQHSGVRFFSCGSPAR
jgi:hypothetical protein